jgi:hypothetical protein
VPCSSPSSAAGGRKALSRAAHYYKLAAGTRLRVRAGATNERLTCHLALRGSGAWLPSMGPHASPPLLTSPWRHVAGAWLTVGDEAREWRPGRAWCFDDSFTHSAAHPGDETSYVLQVQVAHPDLAHTPTG